MTTQAIDETDHKRAHAAKHGLAARMFDARSFDPATVIDRNAAWMEALNPQDGPVEAFLVEQAVRTTFRLERCNAGQLAMIVAAIEDLYATRTDGSAEPIDRRQSPADQIKLLIRYEMHSERTLKGLIKELSLRAEDALSQDAPSQPIPARNEPKPAASSARNEPKPTANPPRNEPTDAPVSDTENTDETNPTASEAAERSDYAENDELNRRLFAKYGPKPATETDD